MFQLDQDGQFQYQIKAESPPSALALISQFESTFHQSWSEPVRVKINTRLAIAIAASGLFAPVLEPSSQITQNLESRWHQTWSEPVRIKPRLHASLNPELSLRFTIVPNPSNTLQGWYNWMSSPVRQKIGTRPHLQSFYTAPPRYLPPANVRATMNALETNHDIALVGINVFDVLPTPYVLFAGANVSIEEVPAIRTGAASIEET